MNYILFDGKLYGNDVIANGRSVNTSPFYTTGSSFTFSYNTTLLANGPHTFYVRVRPEGGSEDDTYGSYGPVTFTVDNGHIPWSLRNNYSELWLVPEENLTLTPKLVYSDKSTVLLATSSVTFSSADNTAATVDVNGIVHGVAIGDTYIQITSGGMSRFVQVHVNATKNTPHFGKDGSVLTSFDPNNSIFMRSMFGLDAGVAVSDPNYLSDFHTAHINTIESGFYLPPYSSYPNVNSWITSFNSYVSNLTNFLAANDFNVLLTGDDIARGSNAVYDASRGPSSTWSPNPITYAFNWAKNLHKALGVEMVDEISSSFNQPLANGNLGGAGGPQSIVCVTNTCTVSWLHPGMNGAGKFLITGATSDLDLNRPVTNLYNVTSSNESGFTFTEQLLFCR